MTSPSVSGRGGADPAALDPEERMSRDELTALQTERLQRSVRHAAGNVDHYRRAFADAGIDPREVRSLDDLARLPLTSKEELRQNYPFGMFAVPRTQVARVHASSGTTGRPTVVGYTADDLTTWAAVGARSLRAAGVRPGDLVHNAYGYGLFTGGLGAHAAAETLGCTVIPMSGGMTGRQVQLIDDLKPDVILCTPTYMLTIIDGLRAAGLDPEQTSLQIGVFGAEPWTPALRDELEREAGIDALDIYGLSEVIGPGVGCECIETKDGTTLWEDHFYPEILDPVTGEVLPDGELGELVFTSLTKQAMPVIRYRTKDLTRLLPGTARPMRRMERISGRVDDMIILRGVNVFPTQIEELALAIPGLSPHFQIHLSQPQRMDVMTIRVEAAADAAAVAGPGNTLRQPIKDRIGVSAEVEVVPPASLERSSGKLRRVFDQRAGG
ncbi:phenylacetate--CoA ligase PaaK [Nakamurella aerolata]|uniref:Phenylacetate-coenzyme A ligase n=1 Tax=Nakamurella aerolata TaxID=1656892 RepID=A0A849ABY7_9ACTN|nr:phenylacetate--CoA ligase PaaK [Nakamurella aerolata]NNG37106.1 phenylacetate--CoA ligase [Nakamurella aerolata]